MIDDHDVTDVKKYGFNLFGYKYAPLKIYALTSSTCIYKLIITCIGKDHNNKICSNERRFCEIKSMKYICYVYQYAYKSNHTTLKNS